MTGTDTGPGAPGRPDATLGVTDLTKTYGDTKALDAVGVAWGTGLHCVAGPNGSGKTTLLRVLAGLTRPDSGAVTAPDSLGFAFQEPNVYPDLTVDENLDVFASLTGGSEEWRESLVQRLRLGPERDRRAADLSGGFEKKLDLALALVKAPDALILDEPLADLDPATRRRLVAVATEYARDHCVLACTHNLSAFREDYESLTVLVDGRVRHRHDRAETDGGPADAYERLLDDVATGRGNGF
ncbi:ABC transporter ATP-binding protein [Halobacterium yunchengense]|uniref:ABC transporter ATP-binding protein n=1 Tax=Halobacterium yunchengense TaxID=3108497 RepID=UPI00300B3A80